MQRHAEPAIPPWTEYWGARRRLGFGVVALIPVCLLGAAFFVFALYWLHLGRPFTGNLLPVIVYVHVGAQFITVLVFGHLMIANPHISGTTKLLWGLGFLFAAPVAVPFYWLLHVWHSEPQPPSESQPLGQRDREVHVYDFDFEAHHAKPRYRREDGTIVHHIDSMPA